MCEGVCSHSQMYAAIFYCRAILTITGLDEIIKRAQEETDESRRLRWVKGALWVAQESSSIEIFHAILRWSGRFISNPVWHSPQT